MTRTLFHPVKLFVKCGSVKVMKRITPAEIISAYETTGLRPARKVWYDWRETSWCGCGLTALALVAGIDPLMLIRADVGGVALNVLAQITDITQSGTGTYAWAFYKGFDGAPFSELLDTTCRSDPEWMHEMMRSGYVDGVMCWDAVSRHFAV